VDEASAAHIVVISGASPIAPHVASWLSGATLVVAVDGGLDVARSAGIRPDRLIGDLDSISDEGLAWAEAHVPVDRHPTDKDHTDTELALADVVAATPARITLVGGGDRLDHTIAALGALGDPLLASVPRLDGWWDGQHVEVLHAPRRTTLRLTVGSRISLLALRGPCGEVSLEGTRWTLDRAELLPAAGHGVSNVAESSRVSVSVGSGVLTVFDDPAADPPHPKEHPPS
jgi:thiamine pyrophosphokinase